MARHYTQTPKWWKKAVGTPRAACLSYGAMGEYFYLRPTFNPSNAYFNNVYN
jgi:hypothetical protein